MMNILLVGIGGFIGSVLRYLIGLTVSSINFFPLATFIVNIIGSFLIGLISAYLIKFTNKDIIFLNLSSEQLNLLFIVGILGGFTTYSAFSNELVSLLKEERFVSAAIYLFATIILCLFSTFIGSKAIQQ